MSTRLLPALVSLLVLGACSVEVSTESNAADSSPVAAPEMPATAQVMEVGCYGCVYEAEGASGCQLAVKIDGNPVLVEGVNVGAHELGLCEGTKQAEIAGEMQGDAFVASAFSVR
jgi:hypothetical protein